jgi:hypothetical protein
MYPTCSFVLVQPLSQLFRADKGEVMKLARLIIVVLFAIQTMGFAFGDHHGKEKQKAGVRTLPQVVISNETSLLLRMNSDFDDVTQGPDDQTKWYRRKPAHTGNVTSNRFIIARLEIVDAKGKKLHEFNSENNDKFGVSIGLEDGSKVLVRSGEKFTVETYNNKVLVKDTENKKRDGKLPIGYRHKDADGGESKIISLSVGDVGGLEFKPLLVPSFEKLRINIWLKSIYFPD